MIFDVSIFASTFLYSICTSPAHIIYNIYAYTFIKIIKHIAQLNTLPS